MALTAKDFEGKKLAQKLALIAGEVGYVQKKGYNAHHKYKFVREADLVDAVRPLLAAAGIVMLPRVVSNERIGELTRLVYEYTITDGTETYLTSALGEGADKQDKAGYKAMTGAQKYAYMKMFAIATGDDPEEDEAPERPAAQQAAVNAVTAKLGGQEFDWKEMAYVRLAECQTIEDLKAEGAKVKAEHGTKKPFFEEYIAAWTKQERELKRG